MSSPIRDRSRPRDVVLYGATGFTGRLVAEYLLGRCARGDLRLALAGRDRAKLEARRAALTRVDPHAADLPLYLADSQDPGALAAIARETSVLCSTAGPYALHGEGVVAACAEHGTDYCDLTGEVPFIRRSIDAQHARARETGARLVHCCGYDSIPSDLGTLMIQQAARERWGAPCHTVKGLAGASSGGISGGTLASLFQLAHEARSDAAVRRMLADPYSLDPEPGRAGPDGSDLAGIAWDEDLGTWTAPFPMAPINTRVVRRSHALLGRPWGEAFRYRERMSTGPGVRGWLRALALTLGAGAFLAGAAIPLTRRWLARALPQPGEGPSAAARERGYFVFHLIGFGADGSGKRFELRGEVRADRDPGYGATAVMLGETALALALERERIGGPGGVLTPASALGLPLLERLRSARIEFQITD